MPEANAIENPAAIATQLTPLDAISPPCANAGAAKDINDNTMNRLLNLRIVFLLMTMNYRQWVVDVIPCRRPHAERWTSNIRLAGRNIASYVSTVRHSSALPPRLQPDTQSSAERKCRSAATT